MNILVLVVDEQVLTYKLLYVFNPDPLRFGPKDTITVGQTIEFQTEHNFGSTAKVTTSIALNATRGKTFSDTLDLEQNISGFLLKAGISGPREISDQLSPEAQAAYDALTTNATVSFVRNAYSITLRPPDWSNKNNYQAVRIQRETKGGDIHVFQESRWPTTETLTLPFSHMTQTDVDNFMIFLNQTLGLTVAYTDHLGRVWLGFITNPDAEFKQVSRTNFTVSIEFQGELQ